LLFVAKAARFSLGFSKILYLLKLRKLSLLGLGVFPGVEHFDMLSNISSEGVNTVLDVGANRGQFLLACITCLEIDTYHAFEPLPSAFRTLSKVASLLSTISNLRLHQTVLSDCSRDLSFYITHKSDCSSYMRPKVNSFSSAKQLGCRKGDVLKLTSLSLNDFNLNLSENACVLLKLDIQGSELDVLRGATLLLTNKSLKWIYCEVSELEHYEHQCLFGDVIHFLRNYNFLLCSLCNSNRTNSGKLLYADALFVRS
jgi:FkbM family methyltransferase